MTDICESHCQYSNPRQPRRQHERWTVQLVSWTCKPAVRPAPSSAPATSGRSSVLPLSAIGLLWLPLSHSHRGATMWLYTGHWLRPLILLNHYNYLWPWNWQAAGRTGSSAASATNNNILSRTTHLSSKRKHGVSSSQLRLGYIAARVPVNVNALQWLQAAWWQSLIRSRLDLDRVEFEVRIKFEFMQTKFEFGNKPNLTSLVVSQTMFENQRQFFLYFANKLWLCKTNPQIASTQSLPGHFRFHESAPCHTATTNDCNE